MSGTVRTLGALAGAALVLLIAAWFDTTFLRDAQHQAQATFDSTTFGGWLVVGSLLVAGSVLLVAVLAWRAASVLVGIAYAVVGGLFAALPWILFGVAAGHNGVPPVLPEPLPSMVGNLYTSTEAGVLNAVGTIGAAMLIIGLAVLVRSWRGRAVAALRREAVVPTTDASRV